MTEHTAGTPWHGEGRTIWFCPACDCYRKRDHFDWERLKAEAAQLGREAGENAAAWWEQDAIGGRVTRPGQAEETARLTLRGLEDGDPAVCDAIPYPNLSGEWAGDPTPASLYEELGVDAEDDTDDGELCQVWEGAASQAVVHAIERACRKLLEDWRSGGV